LQKKTIIALALAAIFIAQDAMAQDICTAPVKTESGLLKGADETSTRTCVWRGVPFAAAPIGDLRWKAPQPAKNWGGVREAASWGHRCMQTGLMDKFNVDPSGAMSEDCLFLNIWRPKKDGKFPVMVWIHGGAYTGGTANTPMYWGDRLSEAGGVVVVTINYRLNVFGFLALPALAKEDPNKSTGSYGSLDQVAALKWVQKNIANFGGDPGNVTIFGESAGGQSVYTLVASPLAKGLFQRAIVESGRSDASLSLETGFGHGKTIAKQFGCDEGDLSCVRKIPAQKLLEVVKGGLEGSSFQPHHDGYFLEGTARSMISSGKYNRVPVLAGSNKNEIDIFSAFRRELRSPKPEDYQKLLQELLEVQAPEAHRIQSAYPLSMFENSPKNAFGRMATDFRMGCPTYTGLTAASKFQGDLYYYRFDFSDIRLGEYLGAVHTLEIPFVFNTMDRMPMKALLKNQNSAEMAKLSRTMQGYWVNFARTGNPNGPGLPDWPGFELKSQTMMVFDKTVRPMPSGIADRCALWDDYSKNHPGKIELLAKPKKK